MLIIPTLTQPSLDRINHVELACIKQVINSLKDAAMIDMNDIHSLTEFQRNTKDHLEYLKKSGKPKVLTVNGRAEIIVQDAQAYQKLLEDIEQLRTVVGLVKGLDEVSKGKTKPASEVFASMRKKRQIC